MSTISYALAGGTMLAAVISALLASALPARAPSPSPSHSRHDAMTGFRGLLAFGIFLHHTFIWFHYTHGRGWTDSEGFRQFGEGRVVLFFMLAATLFYGRLIDARGRSFDWLKLLVSRTLRLAPAYWFAMGLMFVVLAVATTLHIDGAGRGTVLRGWSDIFGASATWLGFSMLGMPVIDAYMNTPLITAGVTWTMPFEVSFYLLLPLLALPLRVGMSRTALGVGLAAAVWLAAWAPDPLLLTPFFGGMVVALAIRAPRVAGLLRQPAFGPVAVAALTSVICVFPTAYAPAALLVQALALAIVAAGNDLFGILRWRVLQTLGNCAYSLYLLHGIALYVLFLMVIGSERAAALSVPQYVAVIVLFTPVVVGLAWASQRWIESPPRHATSFVVAAMRRLLARPPRNVDAPVLPEKVA